MSGLVRSLPHGYEDRGRSTPRARLERFLQLCAEDNRQVANCTTPANYFHIPRRQLHRNFRKPLILMTSKSPSCGTSASSRASTVSGPGTTFHRILWDNAQSEPGQTKIKLQPDANIRRSRTVRQSLLRPLRGARGGGRRRRLPAARRAALSVPGARAHSRAGAISNADFVVPGGAPQHGRLDVHRA